MPSAFGTTNPNFWIGQPRTAINVTPLTGGFLFGMQGSGGGQAGIGKTRLLGAQVTNASAVTSPCGVAVLMPDSAVAIGSWTASGYKYTDSTVASQGSGTDLTTVFSATPNNGFVVGCLVPHNVIAVDITTAALFGNAAVALDYAFWGYPTTGQTSSSATWQTVSSNLLKFGDTTTLSLIGENVCVLNVPPNLMVKTSAGDFAGAPGGYYWLRVRSTTAPQTQSGLSAHIYAGVELARQSGLASNAQFNLAAGTGGNSRVTPGVALQGFFGVTNASNHVYIEYE